MAVDMPEESGDYFDREFPSLSEASSRSSTPNGEFTTAGADPADLKKERLLWKWLQHPQPSTSLVGASEPPVALTRFLHASVTPQRFIPTRIGETQAATSSPSGWRTFTDKEESRLRQGWKALIKNGPDISRESHNMSTSAKVQARDATSEPADIDAPIEPHIVPVGLDSLFSVNLKTLLLSPDFWPGENVRCMHALWFYAPPSSTSNKKQTAAQGQIYPVDPALAAEIEAAYLNVRPFAATYALELAAAANLASASESQQKLRTDLLAGTCEVVFDDSTRGRVSSKGLIGSIGRGGNGALRLGGQIVLRGWEALENYNGKKATTASSSAPSTPPKRPPSAPSPLSSPTRKVANTDVDVDAKVDSLKPEVGEIEAELQNAPFVKGLFGSLISKIGIGGIGSAGTANTTQEVLQDQEELDEEELGEVDELVFICHGIGQSLAREFTSLDFVHAVNSLRSSCETLSASSSLGPLIKKRRAQFIPIRWRADLNFDPDPLDEEEVSEKNRFALEDIKLSSVPLLRQVVNDLVLDVPFYLSHHKDVMTRAVVEDANRSYALFCRRNPQFAKKSNSVSIIAHSLGSALCADILAKQPTRVNPLEAMSREERLSGTQFLFDCRNIFFVGSPLPFFLHLTSTSLLARTGRGRAKDVAPSIAVPASRPGIASLSVDSVYNIYHETDPVAFRMNAVVDRNYSQKFLKDGIAIDSGNKTLLANLLSNYNSIFDLRSYWSKGKKDDEKKVDELEEFDKAVKKKAQEDLEHERLEEKTGRAQTVSPVAGSVKIKSASPPAGVKAPKRPGSGMKRMPSERVNVDPTQLKRIERAEQRFHCLNAQGSLDFYLPAEGLNEYLDAISSHGCYWYDQRFASFILLQLFSSEEDLAKTGREEIGTLDDE